MKFSICSGCSIGGGERVVVDEAEEEDVIELIESCIIMFEFGFVLCVVNVLCDDVLCDESEHE